MVYPARKLRIIGASLVAVLMVAGAYAASGPLSFFGINVVGAQTSAELLREYAAKDSDNDNLPDWQEALYNTDPYNAESFRAGMSDGDAVAQGLIQPKVAVAEAPEPIDPSTVPGTVATPNSLTERFGQTLLKQYLLSRGENVPTSEEAASFVEAGVANLIEDNEVPDAFSISKVISSGTTGPAAMKAYAGAVEQAFVHNSVVSTKDELSYFADALRGDTSALKKLSSISTAYSDISSALMRIAVPNEARAAHVAMANALMHMSETTADMAAMETDPLRALLGVGIYQQYANRIISSFAAVSRIFEAQQITIPTGSAGAGFIQTAQEAAQAQAVLDAR